MTRRIITFDYPYKLESLANARLHYHAKARVVKKARAEAWKHTMAAVAPKDRLATQWSRIDAMIIRQGPRRLDVDNLYAACKPVIDGIASVFGVDDGKDFWSWRCEQNKGPYQVSVALTLTHLVTMVDVAGGAT